MKLLRVDDFPTGVRPRLGDMSSIYKFILGLERRKISYHLGIVPLLLNNTDIDFLRDETTCCTPCLHGFDHSYFHYAEICRAHNDPLNNSTVSGNFNTFAGMSAEEIYQKIFWAKRMLCSVYHDPNISRSVVDTYIPPCNIIDEITDKALCTNGFTTVLSENPPPPQSLLRYIKSDIYGKISNISDFGKAKVVTLHATWEADDIRELGDEQMNKRLDVLANWFHSND